MTIYYVSPNGSDSNNGLGPDQSHASNKPWLTVAKALGAAGIASGDTVHIAPGTYRAATTVAMTAATAETFVLGDPANAQGFKDGSGVLRAAGPVILTAFTTDDVTAPSASSVMNLAGRGFLTFQYLVFVGGNSDGAAFTNQTGAPTNVVCRDCTFLSSDIANNNVMYLKFTSAGPYTWTFDRCSFVGGGKDSGRFMTWEWVRGAGADYDTAILIQNCLFLIGAHGGVRVEITGAGSGLPGGLDIRNCTFAGAFGPALNTQANVSTTIPCTVTGCLIWGSYGLQATTSGQITEDDNVIICQNARTNVTAGSNSKAGNVIALLLEADQWAQQGRGARPLLMPMAGSPLLGFRTPSGAPTVDFLNRPRPAGGSSTTYAVGALERHDSGTQGAAADSDGATGSSLLLTGPADHHLRVPVDATSTTLSIKVAWDATHGDTNKPQAILLANPKIGVTTETKTATGTAGSGYETLTFAAQTPTAKGIVTIRLVSRSAGGAGKCWFDTVA